VLIEPLQKVEPRIRDISLGNKGMIYLDLGYDRLTPLHLLGEGIHRMLSILTKTLNSNNAIVLVDELEFGLHYTSQSIFLEYLFRFANTQNVQLFLTTHSREPLYYINEIITRKLADKKSMLQIFTMRKDKHDKVYTYPYDHEKLLFAMQQDIEMR
jgi:AAA15 family ATPase/GTPase